METKNWKYQQLRGLTYEQGINQELTEINNVNNDVLTSNEETYIAIILIEPEPIICPKS